MLGQVEADRMYFLAKPGIFLPGFSFRKAVCSIENKFGTIFPECDVLRFLFLVFFFLGGGGGMGIWGLGKVELESRDVVFFTNFAGSL